MSDILFWNEARKELNEDKLLSKCDTFVDSLMANGIAYPHTFDMNMDNVAGKTADSIRREMSRLYKLLTKKLKDVTPLTDEFQIHKGFLGKVKGANAEATYLPLVLLFDDGQILTGLAKRYDDGGYKVVKWFLNDEDVTKSVYGNKTRDILADKNYNELAKRLAIIVNYNHKKFVRKKNNNPIQKEIQELEKKKEELRKKKDELKKKLKKLQFTDEVYLNGIDTGLKLQDVIPNFNIYDLSYYEHYSDFFNYDYSDFEKKLSADIIEYKNNYYTIFDTYKGSGLLKLKPKYKKLVIDYLKKTKNEKEQGEPIQKKVKEEPQVSEEPLLDTEETEEAINEELENEKQDQENNTPQDKPINEPQQDEIEEKLKALLENNNPEYIDSQLDEIMENMSDEEFEKYEELMREVNNKIKQLISNKRG